MIIFTMCCCVLGVFALPVVLPLRRFGAPEWILAAIRLPAEVVLISTLAFIGMPLVGAFLIIPQHPLLIKWTWVVVGTNAGALLVVLAGVVIWRLCQDVSSLFPPAREAGKSGYRPIAQGRGSHQGRASQKR